MTDDILGICLGCGPANSKSNLAYRLASAGIERGLKVKIFLFDDGIYNALETKSVKNNIGKFLDLLERGVEISLCTEMAKYRGVERRNAMEKVEFSSLLEFSHMVSASKKMIILAK